MELYNLTIAEVREKLEKRQVRAVEIIEDTFKRIEELEDRVGAFISLTQDRAYEKAREIDKKIEAKKPVGLLAGIAMSIKDNIYTKDIATTCGSKILKDFIPAYNASVYDRLLREDAIMVGKSNMDEFAMGSSTENSFYKKTRNPWNLNKVAGGSSGGSAAGVAAGEAFFSLGTDTGGSIRQPSAFCGLLGLKPSYGLVSNHGLVPMADSLDQIGPITKDVRDCGLVLNIIGGGGTRKPRSSKRKKLDYLQAIDQGVKGMKIAIGREYFDGDLARPVERALLEAIEIFKDLGALCQEVSLPHTKYAMTAYDIVSQAEASINLAQVHGPGPRNRGLDYKDIGRLIREAGQEDLGQEVKRRLEMGAYWLNTRRGQAYYRRAREIRKAIREDFNRIFKEYQLILTPVTTTTAFDFGMDCGEAVGKCKLDKYTVAANLAYIPALSIPCGFHQGLPIGMQLMGNNFSEASLLRAAKAFEDVGGFNKRPKL